MEGFLTQRSFYQDAGILKPGLLILKGFIAIHSGDYKHHWGLFRNFFGGPSGSYERCDLLRFFLLGIRRVHFGLPRGG